MTEAETRLYITRYWPAREDTAFVLPIRQFCGAQGLEAFLVAAKPPNQKLISKPHEAATSLIEDDTRIHLLLA